MINSESVAAVVVTYNRKDILRQALEALHHQTRPVDTIIVVDNGTGNETQEMIKESFPLVEYIRPGENLGPAGGFSVGMQAAHQGGHDWTWLFNDDAFPEPDTLQRCLEGLSTISGGNVGIVCPLGVDYRDGTKLWTGMNWRGRPTKPNLGSEQLPLELDGVTFNGALVHRAAISKAGYPKNAFFMMFEEWEFCLRVKDSGYRILILPWITIPDMKAGSTGFSPPWRGYYQTRNHLAMALERHSPLELFWWGVRQVKFSVGIILHLDRKLERLGLRCRGAWDGFRGRLGRTIEPYA